MENINDFEPLFSEETPEVEKPVTTVQVGLQCLDHAYALTLLTSVTSLLWSASLGIFFPKMSQLNSLERGVPVLKMYEVRVFTIRSVNLGKSVCQVEIFGQVTGDFRPED